MSSQRARLITAVLIAIGIAIMIVFYIGLGTREQGQDLLRLLGITFPAGTVFDEDILAGYRSSACRPHS